MSIRIGLSLLAALALTGCADDGPGFGAGTPPGGGGPTMGGGNRIDAGIGGDGGNGLAIRGTVCEVTDVRHPEGCTVVAQAGLSVKVAKIDGVTVIGTTTTDATGRWQVAANTSATTAVVVVEDTVQKKLFKGATKFTVAGNGSAEVTTFMINKGTMDDIVQSSNAVALDPALGVVVVHVVDGDTPITDGVADALGNQPAYYENGQALGFSQQPPTGENGFVIWFNVQPSPGKMFNVVLGDGSSVAGSALVAANAITFTTATR